MPPEITRLVNQFLHDPERIEVAKPATTAKTITQSFRFCPDSEDWVKREMLRDMIRADNVRNAIIFCNRKRDVAILLKSLLKHGFNAGALHGDMDQTSRMETLDKFRNGDITLLAASDVAARGLDIPDVSHVFNFDLPWQSDDYVHRIGRTGRAGKQGIAQSIVTHDELKSLKDIEKMLGEDVVWIGTPPTEQDFADAGKRRRGRGRGGKPGASRDSGRGESGHSEGRRASGGGRGARPAAAQSTSQPASEHNAPRKDARSEPRREGARPQQAAKAPKPVATTAKREDRPATAPPAPRVRAGRTQEPESTNAVGAFAGNVPAFLRRPPRPAKAAGE